MGDHEILTERDDVVNLLDELKNDPKPKQLSSKREQCHDSWLMGFPHNPAMLRCIVD